MAIQKVKDPIVTELEAICKTRLAMPVTFIHADLYEANFGLDQLDKLAFPVLVHVANTSNKVSINEAGHQIRKVKVLCWLLNRAPDGSAPDLKSYDINDLVNQMRQLAENLIYWINKSSISVDGGVNDFESTDLYQKFDAHLYGQGVSFEWSIDTATNGYHNTP
jgi:hypothetical protein